MCTLNEKEQKVRQHLIDLCRKPSPKATSYQKVSKACKLGLVMSKGTDAHRKAMTAILQNILVFEDENGREPLSAMVVRAIDKIPGPGFFEQCNRLGIREREEAQSPMLQDDRQFSDAIISKCCKFWQDDDNYNAFYQIPKSDEMTNA